MSNPNQCYRCGRNYVTCGLQDGSGERCAHFVPPRNNSSMFTGFFSWKGRYSRSQYVGAILIAIGIYAVYVICCFWLGIFIGVTGMDVSLSLPLVFGFALIILASYILVVAGIKRTHDIAVPWYWGLAPVLALWFPTWLFIGLGVGCLIYLLKDPGIDGVTEHGSNPAQSYRDQLEFD